MPAADADIISARLDVTDRVERQQLAGTPRRVQAAKANCPC